MTDIYTQEASYLALDWADKPENVKACCTLISGGISTGDYATFNLATHVGDDLAAVTANRKNLVADLELPAEPVWLEQVHSDEVVLADDVCWSTPSDDAYGQLIPQADASVSRKKGTVCVVLTADCLPVFFCNTAGTEVAVAHAGWRGLHAGVILQTVKKMHSPVEELLVSFGPAIGAQSFEVGEEVKQAFTDKNQRYESAFKPVQESRSQAASKPTSKVKLKNHYLCDIYQLARIELMLLGVDPVRITGGQYCTYRESNRFYSYRRQNQTGRMANLIWLS